MKAEDKFLNQFKKLEKHLRIEYSRNNYSYSGFMSNLYRIKKTKKNPIISNKYNFDILQQASQIRNIIAHNRNVLIPSEKFINDFERVVSKICDPMKIENVMIQYSKLRTISLDTTIEEAIQLLKKHGYNTLPVTQENNLIGIFTEKSLFDFLSVNKNRTINKMMKIKDIITAIDLNSEPRKYFDFISRNSSLKEAYDLYNSDLKHGRELLLLLVTENGVSGEILLGIVALRDIENALID